MVCRKKLSPVSRKIRRTIAVVLAVLILLTVYFEIAVKEQLSDIIVVEWTIRVVKPSLCDFNLQD